MKRVGKLVTSQPKPERSTNPKVKAPKPKLNKAKPVSHRSME